MNKCSAYVGLDVHKDTIAVAVALPRREAPVYRGEIKNQRKSLLRLIRSLSPHAEVLSFCYEAGPCGYGVYREIIDTGHYCEVVAPSLIPRRAGERVKTDRRDAVKLVGRSSPHLATAPPCIRSTRCHGQGVENSSDASPGAMPSCASGARLDPKNVMCWIQGVAGR